MTHPNRRRGNDTEREFVNLAKEHGLDAERAWGSDGKSLGLPSDVDVRIEELSMQVKRRKTLPSYLQIPESSACVGFRQDRKEPLVLMRASDFFEMVRFLKKVAKS